MARFHVSKDGIVRYCNAKTTDACRAKNVDGEKVKHFYNEQEAKQYVEKLYENEIGTFATFDNVDKIAGMNKVLKIKNSKNDNKLINETNIIMEELSQEEILKFANKNKKSYELLNDVISLRCSETINRMKNLENCNPKARTKNSVDKDIFKEMKRDVNDYKDKTTEMVESYTQSKFFKPKYIDKNLENVGNSVNVGNVIPGTKKWEDARFNTINGEEVGILAQKEFDGEKSILNKIQYKGLEKSKINKTLVNSPISSTGGMKTGALYRDRIWKNKIKDDYARENKNILLINSNSSYAKKDNSWQQVDFDGIIVNTKTKKPEGIIEIKTNANAKQWEKDIPINSKAEALYYLNSTDLKYVDLIVQTNDYETKTFRVNNNDEIVKGVKFNDYMKNNIEPWFKNIKNSRI